MILHHPEPRHTYADYSKLPDSERYQLIGGFLVQEPAPTVFHQRISANLFLAMAHYAREHNLGEVLASPVDVRFGDHEVYQPDILFVAAERLGIVAERIIDGPPDLIIEVLSPSNAYYDLRHKWHVYQETGVREYWIVDPLEHIVEIATLANGVLALEQTAAANEQVRSNVLTGFVISVQEIFLPVGANRLTA